MAANLVSSSFPVSQEQQRFKELLQLRETVRLLRQATFPSSSGWYFGQTVNAKILEALDECHKLLTVDDLELFYRGRDPLA